MSQLNKKTTTAVSSANSIFVPMLLTSTLEINKVQGKQEHAIKRVQQLNSDLSPAVRLALRNMHLVRRSANEYKKKQQSKTIKWSYVFTVLGWHHLDHFEKQLVQDKYYCPNKNVGARVDTLKVLKQCQLCDYSHSSSYKLKIHISKLSSFMNSIFLNTQKASKKINCSKTLPTSLLFNSLMPLLTHPLNSYLFLLFLLFLLFPFFTSISEKTYENKKV